MDQWQWLTELPGPALSLSLASAHSHQSSLLSLLPRPRELAVDRSTHGPLLVVMLHPDLAKIIYT